MTKDANWYATEAMRAIKKYGWRRGSYGSVYEGFCLVGAITYVAPSYVPIEKIARVVAKRIREEGLSGGEMVLPTSGGLMSWNDTRSRSAEDIWKLVDSFPRRSAIDTLPDLLFPRAFAPRSGVCDPAHDYHIK